MAARAYYPHYQPTRSFPLASEFTKEIKQIAVPAIPTSIDDSWVVGVSTSQSASYPSR